MRGKKTGWFIMLKKFLSVFLVLLLVIQVFPMRVFAEEVNSEEITSENYETTVEESYIVGEDVSRRDENTKHFRCADGRYVAVSYDYPVHYNKNVQWEELDFSLQQEADENGATIYSTPEQPYQISVPENIENGALSYSYGEYKISLSYQGTANPGQSNKKMKRMTPKIILRRLAK